MTDPIYLDHNATTPVLPEVVDAMIPYLREHFGNPSSSHVYGDRARAAVTEARSSIAALLACDADEIILTSGGTEANNLAIFGVAEGNARRGIVTSAIEHPATSGPCRRLGERGFTVTVLGVDTSGRVREIEARKAIDPSTALVTIMHSNNETGVVQPVAAIGALGRAAGAFVHIDAAQSVGKVPVLPRELRCDLLSIAGHKLYAPKGVGALYVRRGVALVPFARGAGHERGVRPGTENVASIVGLGVACTIAKRELAATTVRMRALSERLHALLRARVPGLVLHGDGVERLPNTSSVRFPRASGTAILAQAPSVAASTGSACHEGGETASNVIVAMGVAPEDALGTVRLTVGRGTTDDEVTRAAGALAEAWRVVAR